MKKKEEKEEEEEEEKEEEKAYRELAPPVLPCQYYANQWKSNTYENFRIVNSFFFIIYTKPFKRSVKNIQNEWYRFVAQLVQEQCSVEKWYSKQHFLKIHH